MVPGLLSRLNLARYSLPHCTIHHRVSMSRSGPCIAPSAPTNTGLEMILLCFICSGETAAEVSSNCCVKVAVAIAMTLFWLWRCLICAAIMATCVSEFDDPMLILSSSFTSMPAMPAASLSAASDIASCCFFCSWSDASFA